MSLYSSIVGDSPIDPTADIPTTGQLFLIQRLQSQTLQARLILALQILVIKDAMISGMLQLEDLLSLFLFRVLELTG